MSTKKISGLDNIRLFAPGDYEALAGLTLALYPDHADSAEEIRFSDEHRDPKVHWKRYVWIEDGRVVAQGGYSQNAWAFHPQRFWIDVEVHPDFQGRGIGSTFYRFLEDEVMRHEPIKLQAATGDLHPRGIAFAERRGFKREQTERESRLDLARFDPAAWSEARDSVREQGIVIRSYAALSAERDIQRELYELVTTLNLDVPWPDPPTPPEFELWSTRMLENPNLLPEGYHIALDGDRLVGMSNLWNAQAVDDVWTGLTGVLREYRGRGIATALKVSVLAWAKGAGIPGTRTWNAEQNTPMLGINRRLGFEFLPAWHTCAKTVENVDHHPEREETS